MMTMSDDTHRLHWWRAQYDDVKTKQHGVLFEFRLSSIFNEAGMITMAFWRTLLFFCWIMAWKEMGYVLE